MHEQERFNRSEQNLISVSSVISCSTSGTGYYAVIGAVRAVGRAEPGIATQIVGRALDGGSDAAGRENSNHLSYGIAGCRGRVTRGGAGVVSGVVGVGRCGRSICISIGSIG